MTLIHKEGENMNIQLPIKIHNKFDIEIKDIVTGEIVQKGLAENIILDRFFSSASLANYDTGFFNGICYGRGAGILSPSRTSLFNKISQKIPTDVEKIVNQVPLSSYVTRKIVIQPNESVGETITEIGISSKNGSILYTHALIKDSEGNLLSLGAKTDTQEITIYATVYFQPNFEPGITLRGNPLTVNSIINAINGGSNMLTNNVSTVMSYNNEIGSGKQNPWSQMSNGKMSATLIRFSTSELNDIKIKKFGHGVETSTVASINLNLEVMAENNSAIWGGHEFDKLQIGVGDGVKTVFTLKWDEVWMEKPKAVYIDNVLQSSEFTFNSGNITFDTAPADGAVITADYWVKYIPKDNNHVFRCAIYLKL